MKAHVIAYRRHIGTLWMLGKISESEYTRLTGRQVARRLA